jgi:hypothetical protein
MSEQRHRRIALYYLGHFLIYLGCLIVALVIAWLILRANRIYGAYRMTTQHVAALEAFVSTGRASPTSLDMVQLEDNLRGTATGLATLDDELTPFLPLTPYLGWVPVYGGDLQALPHLLATSRDLSQAGVILFDSLSPALRPGVGLPHVVTTLAQAKAELEQTEARLLQAEANLSLLDIEHFSPNVAHRVTRLKQLLPQAVSGLQLAEKLPALLGAESPRTYLILTQNADELRPTGGYINAAGHIVFDRGQIVEFVMQDSYAVDQLSDEYPYPPEPIYEYMAADYWVLRDASWSPDFPTTARTAIELYELGQGVSAEGVIALDQHALPYLLRALEPLEVDGEQVTSKNVIQLMRQHWAPQQGQGLNREWWAQRKSFMLTLAEIMRHKFERDSGTIKLPVLAEALQQALAQKHILIYLADPFWTDFFAQRNWSGSLAPTQGDYLMAVDANLGFNKASVLIERYLSYQVALAKDGSAQAEVNLLYQHSAQTQREACSQKPRYDPVYEQNMERCYWNYVQLIVPAGAQLISGPSTVVDGQYLLRGQPTTGEVDVVPVGIDKNSWGQLFLLAPQESIALDYVYTLPPDTTRFVSDHQEYHLYLQKQPGTLAPPAEVTVTLPEGAQLLDTQPMPTSQQGAVFTYQVNLRTDQEIYISYTIP